MTQIFEGKTHVYQESPKVYSDLFKMPEVNTESMQAKQIEEICSAFDEIDAKAACKALVRKYPGLYFNALVHEYAEKAGKLEAINTVMKDFKA